MKKCVCLGCAATARLILLASSQFRASLIHVLSSWQCRFVGAVVETALVLSSSLVVLRFCFIWIPDFQALGANLIQSPIVSHEEITSVTPPVGARSSGSVYLAPLKSRGHFAWARGAGFGPSHLASQRAVYPIKICLHFHPAMAMPSSWCMLRHPLPDLFSHSCVSCKKPQTQVHVEHQRCVHSLLDTAVCACLGAWLKPMENTTLCILQRRNYIDLAGCRSGLSRNTSVRWTCIMKAIIFHSALRTHCNIRSQKR